MALPAFSLDTLGMSAALGGAGTRAALKVSAVFALFEGGMPVIGAIAGRLAAQTWTRPALMAGGLALIVLGGREALGEWREWREDQSRPPGPRPPRAPRPLPSGWRLLGAGFAVSADELALGTGLGAGGISLAVLVPVLLVQAALFSWIGFTAGRRIKDRLGPRSEMAAALLLVAVGGWFLISGLAGAS